VKHEYQLKKYINQKEKVIARYLGDGCTWRIYMFFLVPSTNTFMVKSLREKHSCIRPTCIEAANSKLMEKKLLSIINIDQNILNEALKI
jgi:hypothetical protein